MPDVARILKTEMKRIAAKEVRASGLSPTVKALKRHMRQLETRLAALEARPAAPLQVHAPIAEGVKTIPVEPFRLAPAAIRRLRTRLRLTQAEFAKRLGVSAVTASQWESGRRNPGPKPALKLKELAADPALAPVAAPEGASMTKGTPFKPTAAAVKRIRARLGLTQARFAKRLGVSHSAVCQWEAGRVIPGPKSTASIAALGAQAVAVPEAAPMTKGRHFKATPAAIRRIRSGLGLTQATFAKRLGVSHSAVYQWEAGRLTPGPKAAASLAALGAQAVAVPEGAPMTKDSPFKPTPAAIKRIRARLGLTQAEFARRLGVSHSAVAKWEAGSISPGPKTAKALRALEGRSPEALAPVPTAQLSGVPPAESAQPELTPAAIKRIRARMGLTQAEFAKRLGLSHSAVYQLEAGRMKPGSKTTASIATLGAPPTAIHAGVPAEQANSEFKATPAAIREMRIRLGLTQGQLAALLGMTGSVISNWEGGRKRPMPRAVSRLKELAAQRPEDAARAAAQAASMPKDNSLRLKATPAVFKRVRARLGVSQPELAKLMGVSVSSVAKWEAGRFIPRLEAVEALQKLEGIGKREARGRLAAK